MSALKRVNLVGVGVLTLWWVSADQPTSAGPTTGPTTSSTTTTSVGPSTTTSIEATTSTAATTTMTSVTPSSPPGPAVTASGVAGCVGGQARVTVTVTANIDMPNGVGVAVVDEARPTMETGSVFVDPLAAGESASFGGNPPDVPTIITYWFYDGRFDFAAGPESNVPLDVDALVVGVPACEPEPPPATRPPPAIGPAAGSALPPTR